MKLKTNMLKWIKKLNNIITQSENFVLMILTSITIGAAGFITTVLFLPSIFILISIIIAIFVILQIWYDKIKMQINWTIIIYSISIGYTASTLIYLIILIINH